MIIHGSQKFFAKTKIESKELTDPASIDRLFCWQVQLIPLQRRTAALLMNEANGFTVILFGLRAEHYRRLGKLFNDALHQVAARARIKRDGLEEYLQLAGKVVFAPTRDRSMAGRAQYLAREVAAMERLWDVETMVQTELSYHLNSTVQWGKQKRTPLAMMASDLQALLEGSVIGGSAVQVRVDLISDGFSIWRRLVLPLPLSFAALGRAVIAAFGWDGSHLSEFELAARGKKSIRITGPNSHFARSYDPGIADGDRRLVNEYLRDYRVFWLTYNFNEQWRYRIRVETTVEDYGGLTGLCLEGEGPELPEGFGGPKILAAYEAILSAEDETHPEYAEAAAVLTADRLKPFDAAEVNARMAKNSVHGDWTLS